MQYDPPFLDTLAGRVYVGTTVRHPQLGIQGLVTRLYLGAEAYRLEVNGCYCDDAEVFELLAGPDPLAQALFDQAARGATSGAFDVYVPHKHGRIYFAETPRQVVALLTLLIGLQPAQQVAEAERIGRAAQLGQCNNLLVPGSFGHVSRPAYVRMGQLWPRPLFRVGDQVEASGLATVGTVCGVLLCQPAGKPAADAPSWYYVYDTTSQAVLLSEARLQAVIAES